MRLELDMGNSFVKWRLLDDNKVLQDRGMLDTSSNVVVFFAESWFYSQITELLVSSVVSSELLKAVCSLFARQLPSSKIYKARSSKIMCGVEFIYEDAARLGVDRCLAMTAAYNLKRQGVLVIDCGSAITVDIVLPAGKHVGGYIFPGFNLLKRTLLKGTSNVIVNNDVHQSFDLGVNTEECVDNGAHMMIRSTLNAVVKLAEEYGVYDIMLTGGDGLKAKEFLGGRGVYDQDLVFKGLDLISSCSLEL